MSVEMEIDDLEEESITDDGDGELAEEDAVVALLPAGAEGIAPAPAAQLGALLGRLPDLISITSIDKAAIEFAFLNSKAARKRLVQVRTRMHVLDLRPEPRYSTLAACHELGRIFCRITAG